jgi:hypothetical protein
MRRLVGNVNASSRQGWQARCWYTCILSKMNNRCLHGVAGLESSQHDSGPTMETIPESLCMGNLLNQAHTKTACGPPQGPGFWAAMRSPFECRRAAPKRDKKTSDQQLGHIFWVAVMGPYGGLLFGTAN